MTFRLDVRQTSQVLVSADNKGPQINIVAWTAMVVMILAVGTRLAIKYNAFRTFGWDDGMVTVAMVRATSRDSDIPMQYKILISSHRYLPPVKRPQYLCKSPMVDLGRGCPNSVAARFGHLKRFAISPDRCK